jgi:hypothetical protein
MRVWRRRRGRKGLPGSFLSRVDGVAGDTRGARAAGEGRFATDAPSGSDASWGLPGALFRAPEITYSYRRNRPGT